MQHVVVVIIIKYDILFIIIIDDNIILLLHTLLTSSMVTITTNIGNRVVIPLPHSVFMLFTSAATNTNKHIIDIIDDGH